MQQFSEAIKAVSDFFWNNILLFLLCGAGIILPSG